MSVIYKTDAEVNGFDIDFRHNIHIYRLLHLIHEAAGQHAKVLNRGWDDLHQDGLFWALSKVHMVVHQYPKWNDKITIETWPKAHETLVFLRDYEVFNESGDLLVSASSEWMIVDYRVNRIMRMDQMSMHIDFPDQKHALKTRVPKLKRVEFPENPVFNQVVISDLDMNDHVNNVNYAKWMIDQFDYPFYKKHTLKEIVINYSYQLKAEEQYTFAIEQRNSLAYIATIYNQDKKEICKFSTQWVEDSKDIKI